MKTYKIVPNYFLLGGSFGFFIGYGIFKIFTDTTATEMLFLSILGVVLSILFGEIKEKKEEEV